MSSHQRNLVFTVVFLTLLSTAVLVFVNFFQGSTYTIFVDGNQVVVEGRYESVADIVDAAGISLRPEDLIFPAQADAADPATAITIKHAVPVTLHMETEARAKDDGRSVEQIFYTHQATLEQFLFETGTWLMPGGEVVADGKPLPRDQFKTTTLPNLIEIINQKEITVYDGDAESDFVTFAATVGEALVAENIRLFVADVVTPSLRTPLPPESEITILRARPVTVKVDGRQEHTRTQANTVTKLLDEMAIPLHGLDYTNPDGGTVLDAGDVVEVIRVTEEVSYTDEIIHYDSLSQLTAELELDQRAIIQVGAPGILRRSTVIRYENGIEVNREPANETVIQAPVNEVLGIGNNIVIRTVDTPGGPLEYWRVVRMRVTAYTAATSGKDPSHPAYGITASGVPAGFGVVAVDPTIVPFRSYVYVPGYGRAFAGDTGGGVKGRFIDLGYNVGEIVAWNGYVDVYYLTPVPPADQINYFLPSYLP